VGVTVERSLGVTVLRLVAGKVPDDQGLVAGSGQEHVGAGRELVSCKISISFVFEVVVLLQRGSQAGDPAIL
jgi:hypothetical protein